MTSIAPVFLCVFLAIAVYDVVGDEDSSHNIQARHFGGRGGGGRGGHGRGGHWGHGVHGGHGGHGNANWRWGQGGGGREHWRHRFGGNFLKRFPMFDNIQMDNTQSINQIISLLKQQPNVMVDIRNYLQGIDASTRNDVIVALQELLKNSGIDISFINGIGGGGSGSKVEVVPNKIEFNIASIFPSDPETQAQIQIYLDGLPQAEQQKIYASLAKLNRDAQMHYLLQISGISSKRSGDISISGNGGSGGTSGVLVNTINLQQLFPNDVNMQMKLQSFFSSINHETQTKIFRSLGGLDANTQIQILRQIISLSQTPGIITITINGETIQIDNGGTNIVNI